MSSQSRDPRPTEASLADAARYVASEHERDRAAQLKTATADLLGFLDGPQSAPVLDDRPVLEILRESRGGSLDDVAP